MSDTSSSSNCDCQSCPLNIRILVDGMIEEVTEFIEYHANRYQEINPNIQIEVLVAATLEQALLETSSTTTSTGSTTRSTPPSDWDGAVFPGNFIGSLVKEDLLWDLTNFLQSSDELDWTDVLPFFRNPSSAFGSNYDDDDGSNSDKSTWTPRLFPLDGDVISLYYRRDLFDQFNRTLPRTWEEYTEAAAFFHGQPLGPGGTPLAGSCVTKVDNCGNEYWTALILASMTQTFGTSSGFFLDPSSLDPLFGPAMEETLKHLRDQLEYGHEEEITGACLASNFAFNTGACAMTYNWGNQITASGSPFDIGVGPTPGSTMVLDRETRQLIKCTTELCPHGDHYEDIGVVNRAPYSAFGGWAAGVSHTASPQIQFATADFFAYVSNSQQSLDDVFPNTRTTFIQPYRQSHLETSTWVERGFGGALASEYTSAVREIQSENAVLELRVDSAKEMRKVMDEQVFDYLIETFTLEDDDLALRREVTHNMEDAIAAIVEDGSRGQVVKLSESYRASIGFTNVSEQEFKNYINPDFRDAAWGLSGLMCVTALTLLFWTIRNRNNKVMKAFQPFLLIQSSIGLLILSLSIIPLGFDDSGYDVDILDITCMLAPSLYVVGFTIFFSSVYSKIRECIKIYKEPHNYDCLLVQPASAIRLCSRLLILNGTLLGLWWGLDPLTWQRLEVEDGIVLEDGTVETYGTCRGGYPALGFALSLYILNMLMTLIASLQAFKCRFLVLEYNEMQWLPLSVFPFLEVWLICGPILPLVYDSPTITFVVVSGVVVVSTVLGGMAVFAPKDWYIRKYYYHNPRPSRHFPERTSSAGVMVLKHPTVECQKEVDELGFRLDQMQGWNTELEIEIRVMKEKVKELSSSTKFQFRESLLNSVMADVDTPEERTSQRMEDYEPQDMSHSAEDELDAVKKFEQVWQMPDDEDEEDPGADAIAKSGSLQSLLQEEAASASRRGLGVESAPDPNDPLTRVMALEAGAPEKQSRKTRSVDDGPHDPLARLAQMEEEDNEGPRDPLAVLQAQEDEDDRGAQVPSSRLATLKKQAPREEEESPQDIIARIIAEKMALATEDDNGSTNSTPEDPLARIMSMETHATQASEDPDVPTMEYQYADDDGDEDEEVIIRKKDLRDLSAMIQEDDLEELERRAAMLAESVKTKLEDSNYADLSRDGTRSTGTGSNFGYSGLARKSSDNQSRSMDGLDVSKISAADEGDSRFISMPESFLDSPKRGSAIALKPQESTQATTNMTVAGAYKSPSLHPSAGESSADALPRENEIMLASHNMDSSDGYVAQEAGEPSEGESRLRTTETTPLVQRTRLDGDDLMSPSAIGKPPYITSPMVEDSPAAAKSYSIEDWVAVGGLAGALAEWSDSQSTSSYAESIPDSVTSMEATTRASALEIPVAKEIDRMVERMDWDGVKNVAIGNFAPLTQLALAKAPVSDSARQMSSLEDKRRKKRELEAWRSSLSKSFETQQS